MALHMTDYSQALSDLIRRECDVVIDDDDDDDDADNNNNINSNVYLFICTC